MARSGQHVAPVVAEGGRWAPRADWTCKAHPVTLQRSLQRLWKVQAQPLEEIPSTTACSGRWGQGRNGPHLGQQVLGQPEGPGRSPAHTQWTHLRSLGREGLPPVVLAGVLAQRPPCARPPRSPDRGPCWEIGAPVADVGLFPNSNAVTASTQSARARAFTRRDRRLDCGPWDSPDKPDALTAGILRL